MSTGALDLGGASASDSAMSSLRFIGCFVNAMRNAMIMLSAEFAADVQQLAASCAVIPGGARGHQEPPVGLSL